MKVIVSLSGGMDSTTVLALMLHQGYEVMESVGFFYGSKHNPHELKAALAVAGHYQVPWKRLDVQSVFSGLGSALLDQDKAIPEGHYEEETMSQTVVPGRNTIFIAILVARAISQGADAVAVGIHSGDHAIYPDCRPEYFAAMKEAVLHQSEGKVTLLAPFLSDNKTTIIQKGLEIGVPYQLTRTCYSDHPVACGKCGSCQERLEAFSNNGFTDPIQYRSRAIKGKPRLPKINSPYPVQHIPTTTIPPDAPDGVGPQPKWVPTEWENEDTPSKPE